MVTKECVRCNKEKPLTSFYKNKARGDGLDSWCKACFGGKIDNTPMPPGHANKTTLCWAFNISEVSARKWTGMEGFPAPAGAHMKNGKKTEHWDILTVKEWADKNKIKYPKCSTVEVILAQSLRLTRAIFNAIHGAKCPAT